MPSHIAISRRVAAGACVLMMSLAAACSDATGVPDLNNVTTDALSGPHTRATSAALLNGLLDADRRNMGFRHIVFAETMARNVYNLDPAENRFITELLTSAPDPGGFVGGGDWSGWFIAVRSAHTLLSYLPAVDDMSANERSAVAGLAQTFKAIELYHALEMRDSLGIPVDLNHPAGTMPGEFRCKANDLAYLSALLDTAYTNLQASDSPFPVHLPAGFALHGDFTTTSALARFNRGWKGKVEVYRGLDHEHPDPASFDRAIAALNASFLSLAPADTALGVYYTYSAAVGEFENPIFAGTIHLNRAVGDSLQPGDRRGTQVMRVSTVTRYGVSTPYDPTFASVEDVANDTRPMPLLANEELVLLRAQAEIGKGDLAAALRDVNYVRENAGGLAPYASFATDSAAISAVLYEKRYSLLLEGAQRLVDLRAYRRFNASYLPREFSNDAFVAALPIPQGELNARGTTSITPVCQ